MRVMRALRVSRRERQTERKKAYSPQMGFSYFGQFHWKHEQEERHHPLQLQEQGMAVPMNTQEMLEHHHPFCNSSDTFSCINLVLYLSGSSVEGDANERAEAKTGSDGQSDQQHTSQPHRSLGFGTVPAQHGQTCIGKLHRGGKKAININ